MRRPDTDPINLMAQLSKTIDELKSPQIVGPDNVLGYRTASANPYDHTLHLTANQQKSFILTFTHDNALLGSIQQLTEFYSLNDPNVIAGVYPAWAAGPPVFYNMQKLPPTDTENKWLFRVINNGASTWDVYFKFYFYGTDSGVFTIT